MPVQQDTPVKTSRYGPRLPAPLARCKDWLAKHHMTLMAIADTPHSIAFGSAIGIFFGFTPLYPLKTILSIVLAWICRCNKVAAAIAVTLHDVLIFALPALYFAEYKLGCIVLQRTAPVRMHLFSFHDLVSWRLFTQWVWPTVVGSLFFAVPAGLIVYFVVRLLVSRARSSPRN
jgi:uncharacterized protein (DUF2062 family)